MRWRKEKRPQKADPEKAQLFCPPSHQNLSFFPRTSTYFFLFGSAFVCFVAFFFFTVGLRLISLNAGAYIVAIWCFLSCIELSQLPRCLWRQRRAKQALQLILMHLIQTNASKIGQMNYFHWWYREARGLVNCRSLHSEHPKWDDVNPSEDILSCNLRSNLGTCVRVNSAKSPPWVCEGWGSILQAHLSLYLI